MLTFVKIFMDMRKVEFEPYLFSESVEIYAIKIKGDLCSEYRKFFIKYKDSEDKILRSDLAEIVKSIEKMTQEGVLEAYFRNEGKMNDRVCAIPVDIAWRNKKKGSLRVYCIRVSDRLLILGGGGHKKTKTYQEDEELFEKVKFLQMIDERLMLLETSGVDIHKEIINIELNID
jgi:hypothetical protein